MKLDEFIGSFSVLVLVRDLRKGVYWVDTCVYGPCSSFDRKDFWAELDSMASKWNRPWVVGGDFNVIKFSNEKKGGRSISPVMREFSDWIRGLELNKFPLVGAKYTWSNMHTDLVMC